MSVHDSFPEDWDELKSAGWRPLNHDERCFYCHLPITVPAVTWIGCGAVEIVLHLDCIPELAMHLFRDRHEAITALRDAAQEARLRAEAQRR